MVGPAGEQRAQQARGRALADGDAARQTNDVRDPARALAEERGRDAAELVGRGDVQVEQPRQRVVHDLDLAQVQVVAEAAQGGQLVGG